ncbi:membrane protein [Tamlana nanhaiensis]|uniref:Membrane protein n=1 Tax=Neotamlana nanhaiensis TaxID=1382798 RepID=A0A0D7W5I3_9FLAO|nr:MerC domain-containing protein [Tamlana nanhaiensis]KJD34375.1 membrane protein [Tamlana nanhaiensis]
MLLKQKADTLGIASSSLCLIHCAATPFLFIAQASSSLYGFEKPVWWQSLDYVFLTISFVAIFYSSKNTSKKWIAVALWLFWSLLLITILDETFELGYFSEAFIYVPSLAIVALHFYNQKYCKCKDDNCCIH